MTKIPKHFTLHRAISRLRWWAPGISEITAWFHICIYQKLVHEIDPTTVLRPATRQMLLAFEMQLIIRILGSCPHFCSCRSSQEHTAHEDPLVAYQLSFAINIVLPSVPSTHQIYSRFNLSSNWHKISWTLAGRELQCLTAVSYFWAGSSRFALKLITSISVSFKLFFFFGLKRFLGWGFLFCFILQRGLEVISDCLTYRCNGHASLHHILATINFSLSVRFALLRAVASPLLVRLKHRENSSHTNVTITRVWREQALGCLENGHYDSSQCITVF